MKEANHAIFRNSSAATGRDAMGKRRTLGPGRGISATARRSTFSRTSPATLLGLTTPYVVPTIVCCTVELCRSELRRDTSYTVSPAVSLLPASYIETTYRRGLFGRRWVVERPVIASLPTAYLPTTYVSAYVPTTYVVRPHTTRLALQHARTLSARLAWTLPHSVYETAYTNSADICCDEVVMDSTVRRCRTSTCYDSYAPRAEREDGRVGLEGRRDALQTPYVNAPLPDEPGAKHRRSRITPRPRRMRVVRIVLRQPPVRRGRAGRRPGQSRRQGCGGGTQKKAATPKSGGTPSPRKQIPPPRPPTNSDRPSTCDRVPAKMTTIRRELAETRLRESATALIAETSSSARLKPTTASLAARCR